MLVSALPKLFSALTRIHGTPPKSPDFDIWTSKCPVCNEPGLTITTGEAAASICCDVCRADEPAVLQAIDGWEAVDDEAGRIPHVEDAVVPSPQEPTHASSTDVSGTSSEISEISDFSNVSEVMGCLGAHGTSGLSGGTSEESGPDRLQRAVRESLPRRRRNTNQLAFEFVRHMKSVPCLKRPWTEVEGTVECIIRSWHELAGKYAPDLDDFLLEVFDTWDRVKTSIDDSPMTQAKETASLKLYRPDELTRTVGTVAALCRALADSDGLFFLSNNDAGDVAGKTKKSGRLALKWLQDHHFIALVEPGENGPRKKKRLAARYRWIGPLE